jgi:thiol-disulfide isomerase/thioredoxin
VREPVHAPELVSERGWLNTDRPLRLARELRGQVVLLDFWTYCCINCMHILPDLEHLERRFAGRSFVVVGVHSAKFDNENDPDHIRAAIQRYGIRHPVIVDDDMRLWRAYGARSWPTRVLIDPTGRVVASVAGEGGREELERAIESLLATHAAQGTLAAEPPAIHAEESVRAASGLSFPGKVLAVREAPGLEGGRLFVADTAHHRIVEATWPDTEGCARLVRVFGTGRPGRDDGPADRASFRGPQGMALARGRLFVADTENHLIRAIDLAAGMVATWAGTGAMTYDFAGGARGAQQGINSPWDLAVHGSRLIVAMAGTHQIWRFELGNAFGRAYAGTGREDLEDGPAERAALAQPSGIAVDGDVLWIADSEVSAVRALDLREEKVFTVIGEGLFDFGDVDGAWPGARLQHPLGVASWHGRVLVADSYNHRLKLVEPGSRTVSAWLGDGRAGTDDGRGGPRFSEPGGLFVAGDDLFVADTNNHRVVHVRLAGAAGGAAPDWREVAIEGLEPPAAEHAAEAEESATALAARLPRAGVTLALAGSVPAGAHLNAAAPVTVRVRTEGRVLVQRTLTAERFPVEVPVPAEAIVAGEWTVELSFVYCTEGESAQCVPARHAWRLAVTPDDGAAERIDLMA